MKSVTDVVRSKGHTYIKHDSHPVNTVSGYKSHDQQQWIVLVDGRRYSLEEVETYADTVFVHEDYLEAMLPMCVNVKKELL